MVCGWDIIISARRGHFKSELWSYNSASHFLYSNEMCKQNECLLLQHNSNNVVILDALAILSLPWTTGVHPAWDAADNIRRRGSRVYYLFPRLFSLCCVTGYANATVCFPLLTPPLFAHHHRIKGLKETRVCFVCLGMMRRPQRD